MGFESNWVNSSDVIRNHYGPRKVDSTFGGEVTTSGLEKIKSYTVDLAEIVTGAPATTNVLLNPATGEMEAVIPAYAKVLSCRVEVVEAITTTGGSAAASAAITVGLDKYSDGTVIDADGLMDATDGALTIASNDIAEPRGSVLVGVAALVPNVSVGADTAQVYAALAVDDITGMTALAGKIRILVEYIDEGA